MQQEKRIEKILEQLLLEWKFLGLSKEKLEKKILEKLEVENYGVSSKKYN